MKIQAKIRTRGMRLVVFAALALFLVTGLVGGAIWIAAAPGEPGQPERYQWSAAEQVKRDQAIAQKDSSLLPACTEEYFEWREETKAARESAGISEPAETDFWSAPGCRGIPDRLVEGPASESGPKAPTASPHDRPVIGVDYDDSRVANVPEVVSEGDSGRAINSSGSPGLTGWRMLSDEVSGGETSIKAHHVIATHNGIHVVYSAKASANGASLSPNVEVRRITDGVVDSALASQHLVATDHTAAVRIVNLGEPTVGRTTYGMSLSGLDMAKSQTSVSLEVVEDDTPNVLEDGVSIMTNPDPNVANLLHGGNWVIGPQGITFGILPSVVGGEQTPSYFKIDPNGTMQEISLDAFRAFNRQHRR